MKVITTRFASKCARCGRVVARGSRAAWERGKGVAHKECVGALEVEDMRNPWAVRWYTTYEVYSDAAEKRALMWEAQEAERTETQDCECGKVAWYRPGVGGWWCEDGHLAG